MIDYMKSCVSAHADAGCDWARKESECPDVVGWRDFYFAPSLTSTAIGHRLERGFEPGSKWYLRLQKPNGIEWRKYAAFPQIDVLGMRALVGENALEADRRLLSGVRGSRIKEERNGAFVLNGKGSGYRLSRSSFEQAASSGEFGGVLTLDVAQYYPSLRSDVVLDAWQAMGGKCSAALGQILQVFDKRGIGLPIGPEASALLANQVLIPVDQIIHAQGLPFFRFTDDYMIWLRRETDATALTEAVASELGSMGLKLKEAKVQVCRTIEDARHVVGGDKVIERLINLSQTERVEESGRVLAEELDSETPDARRVKFCIGWVQDKDVLHQLVRREDVCQLAPKQAARSIVRQLRSNRPSDWAVQWFEETASASSDGSALRHSALYEVSRQPVPNRHERVMRQCWGNENDFPHARAFAAEYLGRACRGMFRTIAERSVEIGEPTVQRASTLALRHDRAGRQARAIRQVRANSLTAAPAAEWVLAGAPK